MKKLKKILFTMLMLFVGILNVSAIDADGDGEEDPVSVPMWQSLISDMTANINAENNCNTSGGAAGLLDTFKVGNDCLATAVKVGDGFLLVGRAGNPSGGETFTGKVIASTNDMSNTEVELSEIVELIYNQNSATTKKLQAYAMSGTNLPSGAVNFKLKAGSVDDALYVYGGYVKETASGEEFINPAGIKLNYGVSTKKFSYQITANSSNTQEFLVASLFTKYLVDYIMEASPNYTEASAILNNETEYNKIKNSFENTYGNVGYSDSNSDGTPDTLSVDLLAKGDINTKIVALHNEAGNAGGNTGGNTGTGNNNTGGNTGSNAGAGAGNTGGNQGSADEGEVSPNTGAFVNVFAIVALISVGTVLVLGNKRKLFRI